MATRHVLGVALAFTTLAASPALAQSQTVADPAGDFLPTYTGPLDPALDVRSFTVGFDSATSIFTLGATLNGDIAAATPGGFYVIGADTGTGLIAPFAALGQPNVRFNQAIVIQPSGAASIGGVALPLGTVTISGSSFSALIPLALLPSTGFAPIAYGFNIWPRFGGSISDFAPENANLTPAVPEPATWAMMLVGFGAVGFSMRRRRRTISARVQTA